MTDASIPAAASAPKPSLLAADPRTRRRNAAEARFRAYGLAAIALSLVMLVVLLVTIFSGGIGAFRQTYLEIPVTLDAAQLDKKGARAPEDLKKVLTLTYGKILDKALDRVIADSGIKVEGLGGKDVSGLISKEAAAQLRDRVLADPALIGQTVTARVLVNGRVDGYLQGPRQHGKRGARRQYLARAACAGRCAEGAGDAGDGMELVVPDQPRRLGPAPRGCGRGRGHPWLALHDAGGSGAGRAHRHRRRRLS